MVPRDNRTEGEIIVKTLKAAFEYYNKPEATRKNYYKGWYYTKDIGTWDEEGYVTVAGRRDDMIVCMGENIHPAQVEAVINEHPKVADNVVVGVPDKVKGQVLAAYVVPAEGEEIEAGELHSFLAESKNLARFKRPRLYKFVGSLPMTATGKKKHFEASKWAKEDAGEGAFTEV
jgi:acyl-coenzyme A synthetase/AMP-(fatty) acid ligase